MGNSWEEIVEKCGENSTVCQVRNGVDTSTRMCSAKNTFKTEKDFFNGKKDETEGQAANDLNIKRWCSKCIFALSRVFIYVSFYCCLYRRILSISYGHIFIFKTTTLQVIANYRRLSISIRRNIDCQKLRNFLWLIAYIYIRINDPKIKPNNNKHTVSQKPENLPYRPRPRMWT